MATDPTDDEATVASTHISLLLLTAGRVYKFRRPVRTDFCDFSTVEARRLDCEREVALNRRLAPDVYLGVAQVGLGPDDDSAEPCVVMRRLPAARQLSVLVEAGTDVTGDLDAVAAQLASFHRAADRSPAIDAQATPDALGRLWSVAVGELRTQLTGPDDVEVLDAVEDLAHVWLAGRTTLFGERIAAGHVVDGHGDLRTDNIFSLDDGPRILDCIEFDDSLRYLDVAADVAFLVMDLRSRDRPEEADGLVAAYARHAGEALPPALVDHAAAYWALVRAKVAGIRHRQGDPDALDRAGALVRLALDQLRSAQPRLVLVGGLPGTGKSTLARGIAAATGWALVSSDTTRKALAGLGPTDRAGADFGAGLYDTAHTDATYASLLSQAEELLARGTTVVLDASWTSARRRHGAAATARRAHAGLVQLRCRLDPAEAGRRIAARAAAGGDPSDADEGVARAMGRVADDWPEALTVDTSGSPEDAVARALDLLRARPPVR